MRLILCRASSVCLLQDEFSDYYAEMPWLALPFHDSRTNAFKTAYTVEGIPSLVLVGPDGGVLSKDGRDYILQCALHTSRGFAFACLF
eukprot:COSAG03_NODE_16_length_21807_cov_27.080247_3_plen_88_part_00